MITIIVPIAFGILVFVASRVVLRHVGYDAWVYRITAKRLKRCSYSSIKYGPCSLEENHNGPHGMPEF